MALPSSVLCYCLTPTFGTPNSSPKNHGQNYLRLWMDVTRAIDETKAVRTLAEISVDKEGRHFVSRLDRKDVELCVEVLDHVSREPRFPSGGLIRAP